MQRPAATAIQPLPPAHPTTPTTTSPATSDSWRPACGGFTWRAESSAPSGRAHGAMKTAGRRGGTGRHSRLVSLAGGERRLSLHHQPDESTVGVILNMIYSSRIAAEYQEEEAPGAGSAAVPESSQDGLPTRRAVCRGPSASGSVDRDQRNVDSADAGIEGSDLAPDEHRERRDSEPRGAQERDRDSLEPELHAPPPALNEETCRKGARGPRSGRAGQAPCRRDSCGSARSKARARSSAAVPSTGAAGAAGWYVPDVVRDARGSGARAAIE